MKRSLAIFLALLLAITACPLSNIITVKAEVPTELSISYAPFSPTVDGVVDASYGDIEWNQSATDLEIGDYNLYPRTAEECAPFEEAFAAMNMKGWLSYDATGLYMAVEATDLSAMAPADSSQPWKSTNIQVVLYTNDSRNYFTLFYDGTNLAGFQNDTTRSELDISHVSNFAVKETALDEGIKLVWEIKIPYEALCDISSIDDIENMRLGVVQTSMAEGYCCQMFGKASSLNYDDLLPVTINPISEAITMGTTGDCVWALDGTTLIISGNGAMADYTTTGHWSNSITRVIIRDGVTSIGQLAFYECDSLTSIEIPNSVTSIAHSAFAYCSSLTSITIPNGVTSIGFSAFYGCDSLTSIEIPNSVTSIGSSVFSSCGSLTSITVDEGNTVYHGNGNCIIETASKTLIQGCNNSVIPCDGSVKIIDHSAFYGCDFTSIEIPNSVTSIAHSAFYWCTSLTSMTLSYGVTSIGDYAFFGCSSLTSIGIPTGITSIGKYVFDFCDSLENVYYCGTEEEWGSISIGSNNESLTSANINYHKFGEWEIITEPDCANYGEKVRVCAICGEEETEAMEALGHNYVNGGCTRSGCLENVITSITLNYTDITIEDGESSELYAEYSPIDATDTSLYWYSSDTSVATVDQRGYVIGIASGTATIYVRANSGSAYVTASASCTVNVYNGGAIDLWCDYCGNAADHETSDCPYFDGSKLTFDENGYPVSLHPYGNNMDSSVTYYSGSNSYDGTPASSIDITFSSDTETESNYDYIYIYDSNDSLVGEYDGTELAGQTVTVTGGSFRIRMTTDGSVTRYGFSIDSIYEYYAPVGCEHNYTSSVTMPTCTEQGYTYYECRLCEESYTDNYTSATGHYYIYNYAEDICSKESYVNATYCSKCDYESVYTYDLSTYWHNVVDGRCTDCDKIIKTIESENYYDSLTSDYTVNIPGAEKLVLKFSDDTALGVSDEDLLFINDKNGYRIGSFCGDKLKGKIIVVEGNIVNIYLSSIGTQYYYGFSAEVTPIFPDCDHENLEWVITEVPDCFNEGKAIQTCLYCSYVNSKTLPIEHTFSEEFTVDVEPTVFEEGSKSRHCMYCEAVTDITVMPVTAKDSGTCGENAKWALSEDGILYIAGSGATDNYKLPMYASWYEYADEITSVNISADITKIGNNNFSALNNVNEVVIENPDLQFGTYVFSNKADITVYSLGGGNAEAYAEEQGYIIVKPENPNLPVAVEIEKISGTFIILKAVLGYEYSIDGINWQTDNIFDGLEAETEYTFYQRIADDVYKVSAMSDGLTVTTLAIPKAPVIESIVKNIATLSAIEGYEYSIDGQNWQSSNVFTIPFDEIVTFYQRVSANGINDATLSSEGAKGISVSAPTVLVGESSIFVKAIEGYEYGLENILWQDSNLFNEYIVTGETYYVQQRLKDTEGIFAVYDTVGTTAVVNGREKITEPTATDLAWIRNLLLNEDRTNNYAADINGDGTVDTRDVVRLKKLLAGGSTSNSTTSKDELTSSSTTTSSESDAVSSSPTVSEEETTSSQVSTSSAECVTSKPSSSVESSVSSESITSSEPNVSETVSSNTSSDSNVYSSSETVSSMVSDEPGN